MIVNNQIFWHYAGHTSLILTMMLLLSITSYKENGVEQTTFNMTHFESQSMDNFNKAHKVITDFMYRLREMCYLPLLV